MEKKIKAKDLMEWLNWKFENFNEWKHKDNTEISLNENGITIFDSENVYEEISASEIQEDLELLHEVNVNASVQSNSQGGGQ